MATVCSTRRIPLNSLSPQNTDVINQSANSSTVNLTQNGNNNTFDIQQGGAGNKVAVTQTSDGNFAGATQSSGVTNGSISITQNDDANRLGNAARATQVSGTNIQTTITQTGTRNTLDSTQSGNVAAQ